MVKSLVKGVGLDTGSNAGWNWLQELCKRCWAQHGVKCDRNFFGDISLAHKLICFDWHNTCQMCELTRALVGIHYDASFRFPRWSRWVTSSKGSWWVSCTRKLPCETLFWVWSWKRFSKLLCGDFGCFLRFQVKIFKILAFSALWTFSGHFELV